MNYAAELELSTSAPHIDPSLCPTVTFAYCNNNPYSFSLFFPVRLFLASQMRAGCGREESRDGKH